ncbi:MAG: hypothetical protein GY863_20980, partial [bacterium]|nr:hypothetical protein [bacterium]
VMLREFNLPEDNVNQIGLAVFKQKMGTDNFQTAKLVVEKLKLNKKLYQPLLETQFNNMASKTQYEKALVMAQEFKMKSPEVKKAAFVIFTTKLKKGLFRDAAKVAKDFKLPKEPVQKQLEKMLELLETKKMDKKVEALRTAFGMQKKGMFSKLFGI